MRIKHGDKSNKTLHGYTKSVFHYKKFFPNQAEC